jgi:hypothetical protein
MSAEKTSTVEIAAWITESWADVGVRDAADDGAVDGQFLDGELWADLSGAEAMVKDGLATVEEQTKDGRAKKVYKITGAGERRLRKLAGGGGQAAGAAE